MGVRASYVAVVIVVVGVDASLIPVNGLLGLNRRGVFVWAGSIIHLLHSRPPRPHRGKRKGGVADNAGAASALALKASLSALRVAPSAPSSLHPSSASSLTSLALGSGAGTVISQSLAMILAFHVSQDFMSDESMCSAGPCALPRCRDARGQTLRLGEPARKRREHKDDQETLFRRG